jgi:hypothetical protein
MFSPTLHLRGETRHSIASEAYVNYWGRKEVADRGRWAEFSATRRQRHVFGKQA